MAAGRSIAPAVILLDDILELMGLIENAAQMVLEADATVFGGAVGVGIQSLQKSIDLLLHIFFMSHRLRCGLDRQNGNLLKARRDRLTWLDLIMHFPLHSLHSPSDQLAFRALPSALAR